MLWAIYEHDTDDPYGLTLIPRALYRSHEAAMAMLAEYKRKNPGARYVLNSIDSDLSLVTEKMAV